MKPTVWIFYLIHTDITLADWKMKKLYKTPIDKDSWQHKLGFTGDIRTQKVWQEPTSCQGLILEQYLWVNEIFIRIEMILTFSSFNFSV